MSHTYIEENVNIQEYPKVECKSIALAGTQISVGDMHGSALKLLFVLVYHSFVNIAEEKYNQFVKLYSKSSPVKTDLDEFNSIVKSITVNDEAKKSYLRLIGDLLADRGKNDYYTLKLLEMVQSFNIPTEILISNHDAEFIALYEAGSKFNQSKLGDKASSATGLQGLLDKKIVDTNEIAKLIETAYKPNLKALSYSLSENNEHITIYSHGVIGIDNIKYMAQALKIEFLGEEPLMLAATIDKINQTFSDYARNNKLTELFNLKAVDDDALNGLKPIDPILFPFAHLIWNRSAEGLRRPSDVSFVHGHDLKDKTAANIYNLDNGLAKFPFGQYNKGTYNLLYSRENLKPDLIIPTLLASKTQTFQFSESKTNKVDTMLQTEDTNVLNKTQLNSNKF